MHHHELPELKKLMSVKQVADLHEVAEKTARTWVYKGYLRAFRVGKLVVVLRSSAETVRQRIPLPGAHGHAVYRAAKALERNDR
jgi:hypothetical protein